MAIDAVVVELVRDELRRISERGELASRATLQGIVGIGGNDLQAALDTLRDGGEISEVEPDGFRCVEHGEAIGADVEGERAAPAPRWEPPIPAAQVVEYANASLNALVIMPRAVADVLDAASLGALVKAGIDTAPVGGTFRFEVTP